MNITVIRAFQTPNLIEFGANIIADYLAEAGFEAENLTKSLSVRTMRYDVLPVIDSSGTRSTTLKSCYRLMTAQMAPGDPFAMTVDLKREYFVNSVLFIQDVRGGDILGAVSEADLKKKYATQWDVYVGNSLDWH